LTSLQKNVEVTFKVLQITGGNGIAHIAVTSALSWKTKPLKQLLLRRNGCNCEVNIAAEPLQ